MDFTRLLTLQELMGRLGIQHFFETRVTAEDGTETIAESLLSAALKLQRPPNQCVVFDSSPNGVAAAHNCTMKVRARESACGTRRAGTCGVPCSLQADALECAASSSRSIKFPRVSLSPFGFAAWSGGSGARGT